MQKNVFQHYFLQFFHTIPLEHFNLEHCHVHTHLCSECAVHAEDYYAQHMPQGLMQGLITMHLFWIRAQSPCALRRTLKTLKNFEKTLYSPIGLRMHPLGGPVLRIWEDEVYFCITCDLPVRKPKIHLPRKMLRPRSLSLVNSLEGSIVLKAELNLVNNKLS